MTVAELLAWGAAAIGPIAPETAPREASVLLLHLLGGPSWSLTTRRDEAVAADVEARFRDMIARRLERCPVQYLTGECEFYGLRLRVGPGVLIPRPETELVVETALDVLAASKKDPEYIVDIGTGSGCIAIAIAAGLQTRGERVGLFHVHAIDTSEAALAFARENARSHGLSDVITFRRSDLPGPGWRPVMDATFPRTKLLGGIRLVVSNPPYVSEEEYARLQPEVRDWEPREALVGGADGLDVIRRVIEWGPRFVEGGGHLVMEIGAGQSEALRKLDWRSLGYDDVAFLRDLSGIERVVRARLA